LFLYWFTQSQSYIQFTRTIWAWFPLYSKFLQITHQDYAFEQRNSQDFWLTQKSRHTPQESHLHTWNHIRQTNQRHKNIQTWWWLSLANHTCVLQATHKPKCLQDQPRSSNHELQLHIVERESFPKKNDKVLCSKTQIRTSALENTTYIV